MDANTLVRVTNRSTGKVYYDIPEMGIKREFNPNEPKMVSVGEIAAVCQQTGGRALFYHYLLIEDDATFHNAVNVQEQPEYWLTAEMIPNWIKTCSLDEFTDALTYAPEGVKDLIKKEAVNSKLADMNKREAIKEILNFDVTFAIQAMAPETPEEVAAASSSKINTGRKTAPNYKITAPKK